MSKFVRALLGAPVLFAALPAFAQEAPARSDEIVVTAERLVEEAIQRVGETPGGANVVPASDFDDKVAVNRCATRSPSRPASTPSRASGRRSVCRSADRGSAAASTCAG
jgi:hypothetical protein